MRINIGSFYCDIGPLIQCVVSILVGAVIAAHPVHCPITGVIVAGALSSIRITR